MDPLSNHQEAAGSDVLREQARRATIYFAWNYESWGGVQIYTLAIVSEAVKHWNVCVILPKGSSEYMIELFKGAGAKIEFIEHSLIEEKVVGIYRKLRRQAVRLRSEYELFTALRKKDLRNSIVHVDIAPWQSWQFFLALAACGANVFVTIHNFMPRASVVRESIWKVRLKLISFLPRLRFFTANKDTKIKLKGWVRESFWRDIEVTYAGIDPKMIDSVYESSFSEREHIRRRFGISPGKFVVLCVGQFIDRKGRWIFLDAAKELTRKSNNFCFVWLMPQPLTPNDEKRISDYHLGESFQAIVSNTVGNGRRDILAFFRVADVFALPSYLEGLPIALLEAMALGIPSISTNIFGIPEAIIDGVTGLLIERGDSSRLTETIEKLRHDQDLYSKLSEAGRDHVMKNFDSRSSAQTAIKAYSAVKMENNKNIYV